MGADRIAVSVRREADRLGVRVRTRAVYTPFSPPRWVYEAVNPYTGAVIRVSTGKGARDGVSTVRAAAEAAGLAHWDGRGRLVRKRLLPPRENTRRCGGGRMHTPTDL